MQEQVGTRLRGGGGAADNQREMQEQAERGGGAAENQRCRSR